MDTVYTYVGMVTTWIVIILVALIVLALVFRLIKTMYKAVDFLKFYKTMRLRDNPEFKLSHNIIYTYFSAVRLMWDENGTSTTITLSTGQTYRAFNWQ